VMVSEIQLQKGVVANPGVRSETLP
jgi:hypothetical protein